MNSKVSYFLSHPIQYMSPMLAALSREMDLEVYYYSDNGVNSSNVDVGFGRNVVWDIPLLHGYEFFFLKNVSRSRKIDCKLFDVINPSIFKVLFHSKSKICVVNGWSYSTDLMIILFARFFGKKVWLRAENPLHKELQAPLWKRFLRKIILKYFVFIFIDKFMYIGVQNKYYFRSFGVQDSKLIYTPYSVDNDKFRGQYFENVSNKDFIKFDLNIPRENKVILFCGKFIKIKRPMDILRAFSLLCNDECTLLLVGDGPLKHEIQNYIVFNNLKNVIMPGFINQSEIYKYYIVADVFVLSSEMETWGLAVNEAMNFRLPCVVSDSCGCGFDLIQNDINGFIYQMGNVFELSEALEKALLLNCDERCFDILNEFSIQNIINNFKKYI